jgi:hypothetical protein
MMRTLTRLALLSLGMVLLVGCMGGAPTPQVPESVPEEAKPLVRTAMVDLEARLEIGLDDISVAEVTETEFSDASLGVPEPGQSYAQVITPGYIIMLQVQDEVYKYHAAEDRVVYAQEE